MPSALQRFDIFLNVFERFDYAGACVLAKVQFRGHDRLIKHVRKHDEPKKPPYAAANRYAVAVALQSRACMCFMPAQSPLRATNQLHCCAGNALSFAVAPVDAKELQSLSPPFRTYLNRYISGCEPAKGWIPNETETIDYYITHTATACAQACIAWNAALTSSGSSSTPCNVVAYRNDLGDYEPTELVDSTQPTDTYTKWNCFMKSIKNVCGPLPPPASVVEAGIDLLVLDSSEYECARMQIHPRTQTDPRM